MSNPLSQRAKTPVCGGVKIWGVRMETWKMKITCATETSEFRFVIRLRVGMHVNRPQNVRQIKMIL